MKLTKSQQTVLDVLDGVQSHKVLQKKGKLQHQLRYEKAIKQLKEMGMIYRDPDDGLLKRSGLKPCPFCGERQPQMLNYGSLYAYVECSSCSARGSISFQGEHTAGLLWNSRKEASNGI